MTINKENTQVKFLICIKCAVALIDYQNFVSMFEFTCQFSKTIGTSLEIGVVIYVNEEHGKYCIQLLHVPLKFLWQSWLYRPQRHKTLSNFQLDSQLKFQID